MEVNEVTPITNPVVIEFEKVTINNYGLARRKYEDYSTKAKDEEEYSTVENTDSQAEIDKWKDAAEMQKQAIEKFEKSCPEYDPKYLGENIKVIAKKFNLKISDVENLIGLSSGYISRTINPESKKKLSIDVVWQISKLFSVNMSDLLDRDFTDPPKIITPVVKFLEKLNKETTESDLHWTNLGRTCSDVTLQLFDTTKDKDGNDAFIFAPPQDNRMSDLKGDIYGISLRGRMVFIMEVQGITGDDGILIYTERSDTNDAGLKIAFTELLCSTFDDASGILLERAGELMNSIRLHESDFSVSDDARSFIDDYMNS